MGLNNLRGSLFNFRYSAKLFPECYYTWEISTRQAFHSALIKPDNLTYAPKSIVSSSYTSYSVNWKFNQVKTCIRLREARDFPVRRSCGVKNKLESLHSPEWFGESSNGAYHGQRKCIGLFHPICTLFYLNE